MQAVGPSYVAFETLTPTSSAAVGFTASKIESTTGLSLTKRQYALVTVEANPIRYRVDGTDPTTAVGHLAPVGTVLQLDSYSQLVHFKAIATGADATLSCSFGE
jgi:hypothetical protein